MDPVAQWADIVFPATTSLERTDICASSHDPYAHYMQQALPPQYDARSDHEIFAGLARALGLLRLSRKTKVNAIGSEICGSVPKLAERQGFQLPTFEEFEAKGIYRLPEEPRVRDWMADFRESPELSPLQTPSGKLELYSQR